MLRGKTKGKKNKTRISKEIALFTKVQNSMIKS
jgi:hypothetical protein